MHQKVLFFFKVDAVPFPDNMQCIDIAGAYVHVWVYDSDAITAESIAMEYIRNQCWHPGTVLLSHAIELEQIPDMHASESALCHKALLYGIAADFLSWPKIPGEQGDPVTIRMPCAKKPLS